MSKSRSSAACRAWLAVLMVLTLGVPTAAYPISLSQLLHLSLAQLLRMEITAPVGAARPLGRGPHGR